MSRDFDGVVPILLAISFATTFGPHHIIARILPYINCNRGSWSRAVSIHQPQEKMVPESEVEAMIAEARAESASDRAVRRAQLLSCILGEAASLTC